MADNQGDYQHFLDLLKKYPPSAICRFCFTTCHRLYSFMDLSFTDLTRSEVLHLIKLQVLAFLFFTNTKIQAISLQGPLGMKYPFRICQRCINDVRQNLEFNRMVDAADSFWTCYVANEVDATETAKF